MKPSPGYDPAISGCYDIGIPLQWRASRAPYGVSAAASKQVSLADATRIADLAFQAWNAVSCPGAPAMQAYDDGPISFLPDGGADCASSTQCSPQAHDVIVFDDDAWPHQDPASVLALTTVTYGVDDGVIFEAYTEVNTSPGMTITTQEPPPPGAGHDLQSILTHEAGHFLGLAHATETSSVMYAYYAPGRVELTADDTGGLCTIYPQTPSSGSCSCRTGASPGGAGVLLGLLGLVLPLGARGLRRKRGGAKARRGATGAATS